MFLMILLFVIYNIEISMPYLCDVEQKRGINIFILYTLFVFPGVALLSYFSTPSIHPFVRVRIIVSRLYVMFDYMYLVCTSTVQRT